MENEFFWVYITTPNRGEAIRIGRILVQERLAACANIFDPMTSIYWWEGALEESQESVLIAKTSNRQFGQLKARAVALHSYECPCIIALPIREGHEPYLQWLDRESRGASRQET